MLKSVSHLLEGFKELRINSRKSDDFYHNSLRYHTSRMRELKNDATRYYTRNMTITYTFWLAVLLLLALVFPFTGVSTKTLLTIIALVIMIPIRQIIDRYSNFHMAYLSLKNLREFEEGMENLSAEPTQQADAEALCRYSSIRYDSIAFHYNTAKKGGGFSWGRLTCGSRQAKFFLSQAATAAANPRC
ncbi:MAG: hypothetical protein GY749_05545 [Desulfobacteraceae bacterium]|nr:hypothetical protein [Desulfobacteraceae bacterium]